MSSSTASAEAAAARFRRPRLRASSLTVVALAAAVVLVTQGALIAHADDLETVPAAAAGEVASGEPAALAEDAANEIVAEPADDAAGEPAAEPAAEPLAEAPAEVPVEASEPAGEDAEEQAEAAEAPAVEAVPTEAVEATSPPALLVQNLPVVTEDDYFVIGPGESLAIAAPGIIANDYDPEGDSLAVQQGAMTTWSGNTAYISFGGGFGFTAKPGYTGTEAITYYVEDSAPLVSVGTIYVTVQEAVDGELNAYPDAQDDTYSTPQDEGLSIPDHLGLLVNDTDADGDLLTIQATTKTPTTLGGTVSIDDDGSFYYIPPAGFIGIDRIAYTAYDVFGHSNSAWLTIAVTPVGGVPGGPNQPPIAVTDEYTTQATVPLTILAPNGLLPNDVDPEGGALAIIAQSSVSQAGGTANINADGSFTFLPSANGSTGNDYFIYVVVDEVGLQTVGMADVTITPFVPITVVDEPGTDPGTTIPVPALPGDPNVPVTPVTPDEPFVTPVGTMATRDDSDGSDASGLALTGLSLWPPLGGAVGVLLLGAFGLVAARRRRRSH